MLSSPRGPSSYEEKSIKGKRHMKKGGKTKVEVTHVPQLLPSTFVHPSVGFPYHNYPCTVACGLEPSPDAPLHSIIISHATCNLMDVPWTCHSP